MENTLKETCHPVGIWTAEVRKAETGELVSRNEYRNLIPTVGRAAMAKQMAGTNTQEMQVTYIAVGSDATAPTNADTALGTETARKIVGSATDSSVEASIAAFFAAGEATGTHREFGAFGDGAASTASGTVDTGILYSHAAALVAVASDETLTLSWKISFV